MPNISNGECVRCHWPQMAHPRLQSTRRRCLVRDMTCYVIRRSHTTASCCIIYNQCRGVVILAVESTENTTIVGTRRLYSLCVQTKLPAPRVPGATFRYRSCRSDRAKQTNRIITHSGHARV